MLSFDLRVRQGGFRLKAAAAVPVDGIIGLIGASGMGKSTFLRALAGLIAGCQGQVKLHGEQWFDSGRGIEVPTHRRAVALVFQQPSLLPHLNVAANLGYAWRRVPDAQRRITPDMAADYLAIGHLLKRDTRSLSGGEAQRVAIARALCSNPSLLLLDEPLAAVDFSGRQKALEILEQLPSALSVPMIYVSHALEEVARLSTHMMLMESGRVRAHGPVREMLTRFDLPLAHADNAEAVLEGEVVAYDPEHQISRVRCACGELHIARQLPEGRRPRLRILARDVSIALSYAADSSILNILPMHIAAIDADRHGQCLVKLQAGDDVVLARLTRQSVARLGLETGQQVFAQIKSVALA